MKNCYLPDEMIAQALEFETPESMSWLPCEPQSKEAYEKLNPLLSHGHRINPITAIFDKSLPNEVIVQLQQFVTQIPHDKTVNDLSDDELISLLPHRVLQQLPDMEQVRNYLSDMYKVLGLIPDDPVSADPAPDNPAPDVPAPSDPKPE